MGAIYRREMSSFFSSSTAYVFLSVFFLFSGYFFLAGTLMSATTDMSAMFSALFLIVLILIPVLTMKLFSEEKKQKTDQGLLTAPVSLWGIVLGKYFAALTLYTTGLCSCICPYIKLLRNCSVGNGNIKFSCNVSSWSSFYFSRYICIFPY